MNYRLIIYRYGEYFSRSIYIEFPLHSFIIKYDAEFKKILKPGIKETKNNRSVDLIKRRPVSKYRI